MSQPRVSKLLITLSVMIPTLIEILDTTVVNVSLTHIQGSLLAGQEEVTWVLTSYLVSNAVVIPMSGWLAALFGRKRYLLGSIAIFTLSSLLCGLAVSLPQLVFFFECFKALAAEDYNPFQWPFSWKPIRPRNAAWPWLSSEWALSWARSWDPCWAGT